MNIYVQYFMIYWTLSVYITLQPVAIAISEIQGQLFRKANPWLVLNFFFSLWKKARNGQEEHIKMRKALSYKKVVTG